MTERMHINRNVDITKWIGDTLDEMRSQLPPIRDEESGHCSPQCPHLMKWEHPFWHNTAWCDLQMRDLSFYDGFLADCIDNKPHALLTSARDRLRFNAEITGPTRTLC